MTFLNTTFLWFLPIALVPVLLHFINKKTPKRVVFSYVKVIKLADQSLMPKKRLRDLLLMILRTLLLLFLVFFFSRPVLQQGSLFSSEEKSSLVLLIDVSASMEYVSGGRTTLDISKDRVQNLIRKFAKDVRIGLVAYSNQVEMELAPTRERSRITSALSRLEVKPRPTDITPAIEMAFDMLIHQQAKKKSILVVSDQAENGWASLQKKEGRFEGFDPNVSIILWEMSPEDENIGIAEAGLNLSEEGVLKGQWTINKKGKTDDRSWQLKLNKRVVGQGMVNNKFDDGQSVPVRAQLPEGGFFGGQIELVRDKLPFDDVHYLAGRVPKGFRLLVVDGEGGLAPSDSEVYYLKLALESPRDPRLESIRVIRPEALAQESIDQYDAIVLANVRSLENKETDLIKWVESGGGLFLSAGGNWPKAPEVPLNLFRSKPNNTKSQRVELPESSPFFLSSVAGLQDFEWNQIKVHQYRPLEFESASEVLLQLSNGDPLMVKKQLGKGIVVCLTSTMDRTWTNFPAKPIFAPLIRELIASLADPFREQASLNGFVDQPFKVRMPVGVKNVSIISPNGTTSGAAVNKDGVLEWRSPDLPGLYQVKTDKKNSDFVFAINIQSAKSEGNLNRISEESMNDIFPQASVQWVRYGGKTVSSVLAALQGKDLTQLLVYFLLLLFVFETFLSWPKGHKTWFGR